MKSAVLLVCFVILALIHFGYSNILCTTQFCNDFLATNNKSCVAIPEACRIQNATHSGVFLPSPGPCNCCEYCVENLDEGEQCAKGNPSIPTPSAICGHSLTCVLKDNFGKCELMNTKCTKEQLDFEYKENNGMLGHLETKPRCDRNGLYEPYKCIPGEICYCVSEDGERIFGEIPFSTIPFFLLNCECSRGYNRATKIQNKLLNPSEYFRCQSNGDYDTLQCIDDECFCVDADNGQETYPDLSHVNMIDISQSSLPCFNNKTHQEAEYYRVCEDAYFKASNKSKWYGERDFNIIGSVLPNCQLDGFYAPVQETITHKYCSDPLGQRLENFEVLLSNPLSLNMNCFCARARSIIIDDEKPECCINGNYKKIQKRRGLYRCVNQNGVQYEKEVEFQNIQTLSCYNIECN